MKVSVEKVLGIVKSFVNGRGGAGDKLGMKTLLLQEGHVDSFALVELIAELEAQLGLDLPMGTLIPEDFESVEVLVARLEQV